MKHLVLPYHVSTASGARFEVAFPLHPDTASPTRVLHMLSAILAALDAEVRLDRNTSNGDVLQALAMALAIRASMIEAPTPTTERLAADLVTTALAAMRDADRHVPHVGRA
jgi:hypothetical protein